MNKHPIIIQTVALLTLGTVTLSHAAEAPRNDAPTPGIYADEPAHLWNRLHQAFFVRPDAGEAATPIDAVDPPLWPNTTGFLLSGPTHDAAIAILDEFLANDGASLQTDPVKRAVLQHDLWSVFDWCASFKSGEGYSEQNVQALRSRLAAAIGRLALTTEEIASLPDNLAEAAASGTFPADYAAGDPKTPFLPSDLLDPEGSWVCVRGAASGPVAPVHVAYYRGNAPFLVFIRLPEGRKATLKYLRDLNQATLLSVKNDVADLPQFPVGTAVALLRQMAVIDTSGQMRTTPLTQTLQMRVYRQVGLAVTDHENSQAVFKFSLKRTALFAGNHGGLKPTSWSEPLSISLLQHYDVYDESTGKSGIKTVMESCIACHSCGGATVHGIFTYKQDDWVPGADMIAPNRLRLSPTTATAEFGQTVRSKTASYEWGLLKGLLDGEPQESVPDDKEVSKAF